MKISELTESIKVPGAATFQVTIPESVTWKPLYLVSAFYDPESRMLTLSDNFDFRAIFDISQISELNEKWTMLHRTQDQFIEKELTYVVSEYKLSMKGSGDKNVFILSDSKQNLIINSYTWFDIYTSVLYTDRPKPL